MALIILSTSSKLRAVSYTHLDVYKRQELADEKLKTKVLNMMIDISDKQYGTQIRKKFTPKQSDNSKKKD